jgi:hypothetical protein
MDPNTGKIYDLEKLGVSKYEAERKGLVGLSPKELQEVQGMNRHERRKWAAEKRRNSK